MGALLEAIETAENPRPRVGILIDPPQFHSWPPGCGENFAAWAGTERFAA